MPDTLDQLKIDAQEVRDRGMTPDRIVLRAIGLGCSTRREIKDATGFDYAAIEKALERESGAIRSRDVGQIQRFYLANENGNGMPKAIPFNRPMSEKKAPTNPVETDEGVSEAEFTDALKAASEPLKCESCGAPRSVGSGKYCRKCYRSPETKVFTPEQRSEAEELRAKGKTMSAIASHFNISSQTLYNRQKSDPLLAQALDRGWDRYLESGEDESEDLSPVGYIEEPSSSTHARVERKEVTKIVARKEASSSTGAQVFEIAPDNFDDLKRRIAGILFIEDSNSPVLREALLEADKYFTAKALAAKGYATEAPADLLKRFNELPSALLKEIRDDDAWFTNAYATLIGILDERMNDDEKAAVWTLILYLKSLEKERYGEENLR